MTKTAAHAIRTKSRRLISSFTFGTFAAVIAYAVYTTWFSPALAQVPGALFWIFLFYVSYRYRSSLRRLPVWLIVSATAIELICVSQHGQLYLSTSSRMQQYDELAAAIRADDLVAVNKILASDANPDYVAVPPPFCTSNNTCYYESRQRPIDIAIASGYSDVAAALAAAGAVVSPDDGEGLEAAAKRGDLPMVRFLVDHGVLVNARDGKSIALWNAVDSNQADIVSLLLDAGANPNSWQYSGADLRATTALTLARSTNSRQIMLLLRRAGAVE